MPGSFEALSVLFVALLPGALYIWTFERQAGRWGIGLSDRLFRFVGGSSVFHVLFAPLTYWLWTDQWPNVVARKPIHLGLWPVVMLYVALPIVAGTGVGRATRKEQPWSRLFTGPDPAPRAWDHVFQHEAEGWIRLRLKSGVWIGGAYGNVEGRRSCTAGYPEQQDLFLSVAVQVDPDSGAWVLDADGFPVLSEGGLLVRWEEVEYLEFIDA